MKPNRFFKLTNSVLLFALLSLVSFAHGQALTPQERELADYVHDHYTKREVMIQMRDGVKLFTAIYEPKDNQLKYAILICPEKVARLGEIRSRD